MRAPDLRRTLPGWRDPEAVMRRFGASGDVIWSDAGADATEGETVLGWGDARLDASVRDPASVDEALRTLRASAAGGSGTARPLGWFGWLGYGFGAHTLGLGPELGDPEQPDLRLLRVDRALVFDHARHRVELVTRGDAEAWRAEVERWWSDGAEADEGVATIEWHPDARWRDGDVRYRALIAGCQRAIRAGDAYQLCLTTSASVSGVTLGEAPAVYARLRRASPAPRASFVRLGDVAVLGASPESFLRVSASGLVTSSPIKGTRPRGTTPERDRQLAAELLASPKERAENVMIVDLVRNDLSRVCRPESVVVTELLALHSYAHVHQLVSTVEGRLDAGSRGIDAVLACFPAGSMTGAPKRRAVQELAAAEGAPRGIYAGAIGRFGDDGTIDLSMVIRSIVIADDRALIGVGGGITASSVPDEEVAEIHLKAAALLAALGSR